MHNAGVANTFKNLRAAKKSSWIFFFFFFLSTATRDTRHTDNDFLRTILHFSGWTSTSRTYSRIMCKPDGYQNHFRYPRACDPASMAIWQIFTGAWWDLGLSLVLADSWLVCLPSWVGGLLSTGSELVEVTGSELSPRLRGKPVRASCTVFRHILLGWKKWGRSQTQM